MIIQLTDAEEDFGTLVITTERDDSSSIALAVDSDFGAELRMPLYAFEAREIIAALQPLANSEP
jgi:hypothetical protein